MKKRFKKYCSVGLLSLILLLVACTHNMISPTPISYKSSTPTPSPMLNQISNKLVTSETSTYSTIPNDADLDQTCRITITYFFSVDKSFDIEAVRNLFVPSRQDLADSIMQRQAPLLLLEVRSASEWWQQNHPNELIPAYMQPETKNQYVYYAKYTGTYAPETTEIAPYPNAMLIIVESRGQYDCKIVNYGWG